MNHWHWNVIFKGIKYIIPSICLLWIVFRIENNRFVFYCFFFLLVFYFRFDTNKSTKGASKLRRDLINTEIANLRDLLPLPQSTRQRLSQLQLMALVCVYVRKANYFQQGTFFFLFFYSFTRSSQQMNVNRDSMPSI